MTPNDALLSLLAELQGQVMGLRQENATLREQAEAPQAPPPDVPPSS